MIRFLTIISTVFISLTALAGANQSSEDDKYPVCESIIIQTSEKTIKENNTSFFKLAYEGPKIIKGNRGHGFLDDSTGYPDVFYWISHSGDQTRLTGAEANGAAAVGNLNDGLGLIFTPISQIAKDLSIDSIVVFCGTDKNDVLKKRDSYAHNNFLIIKPFSNINK